MNHINRCTAVLVTIVLAGMVASCGKVDFRHSVAVGDTHACALNDQQHPVCWGNITEDERNALPHSKGKQQQFKRLAAHGLVTCGIDMKNRLKCWGSNRYGDLQGFKTLQLTVGIRDIAIGDRFICLLNQDSALVCAGNTPTDAPLGRRLRQIACHNKACCGLWPNGLPVCFGDPALASSPGASMHKIAMGNGYAVALDNGGHPWVWGSNQSVLQDAPNRSAQFDAVAAGDRFACARRKSDGHLHCFGAPLWGFAPSGAAESETSREAASFEGTQPPHNVLPHEPVLGFDIGRSHGCALLENGGVTCFGNHEQSQFINLPQDPLWALPKWRALLLERVVTPD